MPRPLPGRRAARGRAADALVPLSRLRERPRALARRPADDHLARPPSVARRTAFGIRPPGGRSVLVHYLSRTHVRSLLGRGPRLGTVAGECGAPRNRRDTVRYERANRPSLRSLVHERPDRDHGGCVRDRDARRRLVLLPRVPRAWRRQGRARAGRAEPEGTLALGRDGRADRVRHDRGVPPARDEGQVANGWHQTARAAGYPAARLRPERGRSVLGSRIL